MTQPPSFAFVLLPNFTLAAFSMFVDVLRLAADEGDLSKPVRCKWTILGNRHATVRSSCGVEVAAWEEYGDPEQYDYIVIAGGLLHGTPQVDAAATNFIRQAGKSRATIVGICTGTVAMMQAGVLDGHLCCVHWFHYRDFLERFPAKAEQVLADRLFVVDGRRITCAGGRAAIDVAAAILRRHIPASIIKKALNILVVDEVEAGNAPQPHPPMMEPVAHPKLKRAITLLVQQMSDPPPIDSLARTLGISQRQLERLFKSETGFTPHAYSKRMQLRSARWMLEHTSKSVTAIASDCGFADGSHLGRELRSLFGLTPTQIRRHKENPQEPEILPGYQEIHPGRGPFL